MSSLRGRLLVWLLGAVALVGAGATFGLYRSARAQADLAFDDQLRQAALALRDQTFLLREPQLGREHAEADIILQVWSLDGLRVYLSHPHSVVPGLTTLGFSTVATSAGKWRVYGVQTPLNVVQAAQPLAVREERAFAFALRVMTPFIVALPVLGALIWFTVGHALAPLSTLARGVRARPAAELAPLPDAGLPNEVQPLVAALNALLARVASSRERERAFLADAAHELRTPLTALRLQLQQLATAGEPQRSDAVAGLSAGIERATRLIEQILALARQEAPGERVRGAVALDALARDVAAEMLPLADARGLDLGVAQAPPRTVTGVAEELRTLLRNLVDNALRYTPAGGRVDIAVAGDASAPRLRVTDTGPGLPEEQRARVFDRFYRVPGSAASGSGLGLAIVKAIADAHGATLELGAGPDGRGLSVEIRFPSESLSRP